MLCNNTHYKINVFRTGHSYEYIFTFPSHTYTAATVENQATTAVTYGALPSAAERQRLGASQQILKSVGNSVRYLSVKVKVSLQLI